MWCLYFEVWKVLWVKIPGPCRLATFGSLSRSKAVLNRRISWVFSVARSEPNCPLSPGMMGQLSLPSTKCLPMALPLLTILNQSRHGWLEHTRVHSFPGSKSSFSLRDLIYLAQLDSCADNPSKFDKWFPPSFPKLRLIMGTPALVRTEIKLLNIKISRSCHWIPLMSAVQLDSCLWSHDQMVSRA